MSATGGGAMLCSAGLGGSCTGDKIFRASCSNDRICSLCSWRRISSAPISRSTSCLMALKLRFRRPIQRPAVRAAPGRRSGPSTSRATRPTRSSSEKLIPNISQCSRVFADRLFDFFSLHVEGSTLGDRLACRRVARWAGWRRVSGGVGRLFVVVHGLAKALDRLAHVGAEVFQFLGAKYQNDHHQNDDPVFPVKNAHAAIPL